MNCLNSHQLVTICVLATLGMIAPGCRNMDVNDKPSVGLVLPKARMENDSVAVRVAVVELDRQQQASFRSFIGTTDFQKLPLATRKRLDENGMRASVVSSVNSPQVQSLLAPLVLKKEWLSKEERELAEAGKLAPVSRLKSHRHVERKRGRSFNIELSPVMTSATWKIHDGVRTVTDHATMAQCQLKVTPWPQIDGSVRLDFLPEIHFGQNMSRIGANGDDFAVRTKRRVKELHPLAFEVTIGPGETVVVAPTNHLERIGELFFGAKDSDIVATDPDTQSIGSSFEDDLMLEEFFPMLGENSVSSDASVLFSEDQIEDIELSPSSGRPKPWQRLLMVRVVDVTAPSGL